MARARARGCARDTARAYGPVLVGQLKEAPDEQALTHKLWAKEFLQSTNRVDLTSIAQHSMCGVTSELLKPGVDPRKVIRLVEQLRGIALSRAQEGHKQEALVALKQVNFILPALHRKATAVSQGPGTFECIDAACGFTGKGHDRVVPPDYPARV